MERWELPVCGWRGEAVRLENEVASPTAPRPCRCSERTLQTHDAARHMLLSPCQARVNKEIVSRPRALCPTVAASAAICANDVCMGTPFTHPAPPAATPIPLQPPHAHLPRLRRLWPRRLPQRAAPAPAHTCEAGQHRGSDGPGKHWGRVGPESGAQGQGRAKRATASAVGARAYDDRTLCLTFWHEDDRKSRFFPPNSWQTREHKSCRCLPTNADRAYRPHAASNTERRIQPRIRPVFPTSFPFFWLGLYPPPRASADHHDNRTGGGRPRRRIAMGA